jgi:hypothetical protein
MDLGYGDAPSLSAALEEISRLFGADTAAIPASLLTSSTPISRREIKGECPWLVSGSDIPHAAPTLSAPILKVPSIIADNSISGQNLDAAIGTYGLRSGADIVFG